MKLCLKNATWHRSEPAWAPLIAKWHLVKNFGQFFRTPVFMHHLLFVCLRLDCVSCKLQICESLKLTSYRDGKRCIWTHCSSCTEGSKKDFIRYVVHLPILLFEDGVPHAFNSFEFLSKHQMCLFCPPNVVKVHRCNPTGFQFAKSGSNPCAFIWCIWL